MRKYSALAALQLLDLARRSEPGSPELSEVIEELRLRRSRAARSALEEISLWSDSRGVWQPDLAVIETFDDLEEAHESLRTLWDIEGPSLGGSIALHLSIGAPANGRSIGFSAAFKKSVAAADKNTQGRIMAALSELVDAPTKPRGDTVKPLSNAFKGLWRYRIGDYRLIYEPRVESLLVLLIDFVARGGAYSDA